MSQLRTNIHDLGEIRQAFQVVSRRLIDHLADSSNPHSVNLTEVAEESGATIPLAVGQVLSSKSDGTWDSLKLATDLNVFILDSTQAIGVRWGYVSAIVSTTAPTDPTDGTLWLDTSATGSTTLTFSVATVTVDTTLTTSNDIVLCDASAGSLTITLPASSGVTGKVYHIKKIDSSTNTVTINGNASETIDGDLTAVETVQYESVTISCDGSNWHLH